MKIRELSMGEKQVMLKLREDGKSIRAIAQTLATASTTIWNALKKKESTGVLSNRRHSCQWYHQQPPEGKSGSITIHHSQKTSGTKVQRLHQKTQTIHQHKDWKAKKYGDVTQKFWNNVLRTDETKITFTKVMERLMCGERKDLLMIPNTQAHRWNTVDIMSWLGLEWLLVGWANWSLLMM